LSELVLLTREGAAWRPAPPGSLTLAALAEADAFAILPPDSEGLPEGALLAGISPHAPFGCRDDRSDPARPAPAGAVPAGPVARRGRGGLLAALRPRPLGVEEVALDLLPGRVLARDIAAPVDAPPFDRATVDGFAVRAADLFEASAPSRCGCA
jgi:molybdopterin biosynthesis enzyme